jgi:hypothetical protein
MQQELAETIALQTLTWLVGNDELMSVFLGASGGSVDDFRERAADPVFLASVLDFVMMDDAWVIEACEINKVPYESLTMARALLPGGDLPNWT